MSETVHTVRKFYVGGDVSQYDWGRILQELDTQHRNKNKLIANELARRDLIRQIQAEHPTIGGLTTEYNVLKAEKAGRVDEVQAPYQQQLASINAQIRDAKKGKSSVSALVKQRRRIEAARKRAASEATTEITAQLKALGERLREAKREAKEATSAIRERAKPLKARLKELKALAADCDKATELLEERRALREELRGIQREANDQDVYGVVNQHIEELNRLACTDMSDDEAAQYGFKYGKAGHSGTKWWILENAKQGSKQRSKNMGPEHDPKYLRFQPHYLREEIREGTLCSGINQAGPKGPLKSYDSPNKSRLFIPTVPSPIAYDKTALRRCERRRAQRADVYFRLGTAQVYDEAAGKIVEKPDWIHLPQVRFHQEVPEGAIVKEALLKLESEGTLRKLYLILTLEITAPEPIIPETMESAIIKAETRVGDGALTYARLESNLESRVLWHSTDPRRKVRKWNKLDGKTSGVRRDEDGNLRKIVNGQWVKNLSDSYTYVEGLIRTQKDWLQCLPDGKARPTEKGEPRMGSRYATVVLDYIAKEPNLPACLADAASRNIFEWKSTRKLQHLYRQWANDRVEGDEEAFDAMKEWAAHDLHLYQWARSMTERLARRKIDTFRKEALRLCRTYKTLYVDDIDRTERKKGVTEEQATELTKWNKRAGFGLFREILKQTAKRCGTELIVGFPDTAAAAA